MKRKLTPLNRSRCAGWISTACRLARCGHGPDSQQIPLCGMDFNKASAVVPYGTLALSTDPAVRDGFQRQL